MCKRVGTIRLDHFFQHLQLINDPGTALHPIQYMGTQNLARQPSKNNTENITFHVNMFKVAALEQPQFQSLFTLMSTFNSYTL